MANEQKKEKTIGVRFILGWIIGMLFFILGAINIFKHPVMGIFEIMAALAVFPPFMQFLKDKTGIKLSGVLRIILFCVLLGLGVGLSTNTDSKTAQTNTSTALAKPTGVPTPIVMNLSELIDQYGKNKVSIQSKYSAKTIQVSGFIKDISSDIVNAYYLELAPTNEEYYWGTTIKCYFVDKSALVDVSKGQSVIVAGVLQDTSYDSWIELHDCSVVK